MDPPTAVPPFLPFTPEPLCPSFLPPLCLGLHLLSSELPPRGSLKLNVQRHEIQNYPPSHQKETEAGQGGKTHCLLVGAAP